MDPFTVLGPCRPGIAGAADGATAVAVIACAAGKPAGEVKDFQVHDAGNGVGVGVGEAVDVMTSLMEDKDGGQLHTPTPVSTTCFNFTIQQVRSGFAPFNELPENQYQHYRLRQRAHNKALIPKTTYLSDRDYIMRMLVPSVL